VHHIDADILIIIVRNMRAYRATSLVRGFIRRRGWEPRDGVSDLSWGAQAGWCADSSHSWVLAAQTTRHHVSRLHPPADPPIYERHCHALCSGVVIHCEALGTCSSQVSTLFSWAFISLEIFTRIDVVLEWSILTSSSSSRNF